MYIVGYTSVRSILSIAVAEGSVACAQDRTAAAAAASATDATISHCLDERKGSKATGFAYASCVLQRCQPANIFALFKKKTAQKEMA